MTHPMTHRLVSTRFKDPNAWRSSNFWCGTGRVHEMEHGGGVTRHVHDMRNIPGRNLVDLKILWNHHGYITFLGNFGEDKAFNINYLQEDPRISRDPSFQVLVWWSQDATEAIPGFGAVWNFWNVEENSWEKSHPMGKNHLNPYISILSHPLLLSFLPDLMNITWENFHGKNQWKSSQSIPMYMYIYIYIYISKISSIFYLLSLEALAQSLKKMVTRHGRITAPEQFGSPGNAPGKWGKWDGEMARKCTGVG